MINVQPLCIVFACCIADKVTNVQPLCVERACCIADEVLKRKSKRRLTVEKLNLQPLCSVLTKYIRDILKLQSHTADNGLAVCTLRTNRGKVSEAVK